VVEDLDDGEITVRCFQETNYPGVDIAFPIDGGLVCEMQLNVVQ